MAVVAVAAVMILFVWGPERRPGLIEDPIDPSYPDLAMAPLDIQGIAIDSDTGEWRLRFGATILNLGDAPFRVAAYRRLAFLPWQVFQQVEDSDGQYTEIKAPVGLVWGGDGHSHWHVQDVETHWIETLDGREISRVLKQGYCFFDTTPYDLTLPGAPERSVFAPVDCGARTDTTINTGLSVGWGDLYPWQMFEQQLDVTGIEDGRYRVRATADPANVFVETDESNNGTSSVIEISRDEDGFPVVTIVDQG